MKPNPTEILDTITGEYRTSLHLVRDHWLAEGDRRIGEIEAERIAFNMDADKRVNEIRTHQESMRLWSDKITGLPRLAAHQGEIDVKPAADAIVRLGHTARNDTEHNEAA